MASLELDLLGGFQARAAGVSVDVPSRKERALLAVLALAPGQRHSRDKLAGLLWSDRGDKQARDSLKSAISRIKEAFGSLNPPPIVSERECVSLDREKVAVDVAVFERLIGEGTPEAIAQAITVYRGDLLDGLDVRDPAFEEWLLLERQRLRILARDALGVLLNQHLAIGAHDSAAAVAHRLLALDPLREAAHRALMLIYAAQGQTPLALKQYQSCRDTLQRELGVKPESETDKLYRSIQEKRAAIRPTVGEPKVMLSETKVPPGASPRLEPEAAASVKPTIAVLPFRNLSGDPDQQYFSDGITDDIITELTRFRELFVIARHSSFQFRDKAADMKEIGRHLGVEYVVDGSVRRSAGRVRITARLIEAGTGGQLWSEHYDRDMTEIFAIQDQVVQAIVAALPERILEAGARSARRKRPENLSAYDYLWRGMELHLTYTDANTQAVREMYEKTIALDPTVATAYALLSVLQLREWWSHRSVQALDSAFLLAKKAVTIDGNDGRSHGMLGCACLERRQFDDATFHIERFLALNPNDPTAAVHMGALSAYLGRAEKGIAWIEKAFRLNPYAPPWYNVVYGMILFAARRYADAITAFNRILTPHDPGWDFIYLVASHGHLDRLEEARALAAECATLAPGVSLLEFAAKEPFKHQADLEHLLDGLRKASLHE